jgi:hypothetical protein
LSDLTVLPAACHHSKQAVTINCCFHSSGLHPLYSSFARSVSSCLGVVVEPYLRTAHNTTGACGNDESASRHANRPKE